MNYDASTRADAFPGPILHATTILCVRRGGQVALGGDGQVSLGDTVVKGNARKVRRLHGGKVIAGFAGASADAFALFELFEEQLRQHRETVRAAVELARRWRTDRSLRALQAMLAVADANSSLIISGTGDVIEPEEGLLAIGSGGGYARAAARALLSHSSLSATEVVSTALGIAADICVYTNHCHSIETLDTSAGDDAAGGEPNAG